MTPPRSMSRAIGGLIAIAAIFASAGCASAGSPDASPSPASSETATATPTPTPTSDPCDADDIIAGMSPIELAGQLVMVGLNAGHSPDSLAGLIERHRVTGVLLIGGWHSGADDVRAATSALQELAADSPFDLLISADQEGGHIQQLQGPGFSTIPKALEQGALRPAELEADAELWGEELLDAGVNVNLAPVADTVPKSLGFDNAPIGFYSRQFSSKPETVATHVTAVVDGLAAAGVASTLKHFPGLGRVDENTDFSADGITDPHTGPDDPYLVPFQAGIDAGADIVMVSSAVYPKIDKRHQAMFSSAVITDLLRGDLGFDGVVMTDDIGGAASVSHIPVGQRATRFLSAGGDILLTVSADTVGPLLTAIADGTADPEFAALVDAAARRVIALKLSLGLVRDCGVPPA